MESKLVLKLLAVIYQHYKVKNISSRCRKNEYVMSRHIFHYLMRKHTQRTLASIGQVTNRDYSTVLNSAGVLRDLIDTNSETRKIVETIEQDWLSVKPREYRQLVSRRIRIRDSKRTLLKLKSKELQK